MSGTLILCTLIATAATTVAMQQYDQLRRDGCHNSRDAAVRPADDATAATTVAIQQHIDQLRDAPTVAMQQYDQPRSSTSTSYAMQQHIGKQMEDNKEQNEYNPKQTNQIQTMLEDAKRGFDYLVGLFWELVKDTLWDWAKVLLVSVLKMALVGCPLWWLWCQKRRGVWQLCDVRLTMAVVVVPQLP